MPIKSISLTTPVQNTQKQFDRQRRMAELLQRQSFEPLPGGRMVGRTYVPMHPLQGVAQIGKMLAANSMMSRAEEKEDKYNESQRQSLVEALKGYKTDTAGTPAIEGRPEVQATPEQGNPNEIWTGGNTHVPAQPYQPAIQAQPAQPVTQEQKEQAIMNNLLNSDSEKAQTIGAKLLTDTFVPKAPVEVKGGNSLVQKLPDGTYGSVYTAPKGEDDLESKVKQAQQLNDLIENPNTPQGRIQGYKDQLNKLQQTSKQISPTVHVDRADRFKIENTPEGLVKITSNGIEKLYEDENKTKRMIRSTADPEHQAKKAKYKIIGKTYGEDTAKAYMDLPKSTNHVYRATRQLRALPKHKAFSSSVGFTWKPGAKHVHGSPEADFHAKVEQLMNGAFLDAFQALKGGGHITEIEGEKATKAKARLSTNLSEQGFKEAINDYIDVLEEGLRLQELKAGQVDTEALGISEGERYQTVPTGRINTGGGLPTQDAIEAEMKRRGL